MKPFEAPANANIPATLPMLWLQLPMAACATAIDVATCQLRGWTAMHQAMVDLSWSAWRPEQAEPASTEPQETSPGLASTVADVRSAGAAMLQAQLDAMQAFRRSA